MGTGGAEYPGGEYSGILPVQDLTRTGKRGAVFRLPGAVSAGALLLLDVRRKIFIFRTRDRFFVALLPHASNVGKVCSRRRKPDRMALTPYGA